MTYTALIMLSVGGYLLFSYVALTLGVFTKNGMYNLMGLLWVLASFLSLLSAAFLALRRRTSLPPPQGCFTGALLLFLGLGMLKMPGIYLQSQTYAVLSFYTSLLLIPVTILFYVRPTPWKERVRSAAFFSMVIIASGLRVGMLSASPSPFIDVFTITQESAAHLLMGLNPYTTPVSDVYHGITDFGFHAVGYHYPPASLYLLAMGYALLGDVRYISLLCEGVVAFVLWSVARRGSSRRVAELLVLLFLYHPRSLFILEQGWTEPLILLFFSLFLLLRMQGKHTLAAMAYGYFLSLKQYLVYFAVHWFMVERRFHRLALGMVVAGLTVLPFLLLDARGFSDAAIASHLHAAFRADSLSLSAVLYRMFGWKLWALSGAVVGGIVAPVAFFLFRGLPGMRGYLFAVTTTTFALFLFGNLAYANYYYFVGGLLLFLLAVYSAHDASARTALG